MRRAANRDGTGGAARYPDAINLNPSSQKPFVDERITKWIFGFGEDLPFVPGTIKKAVIELPPEAFSKEWINQLACRLMSGGEFTFYGGSEFEKVVVPAIQENFPGLKPSDLGNYLKDKKGGSPDALGFLYKIP